MSELPDIAASLPPISPESPCGPDLDAEGDADFMNFMAGAEGLLPAAFFAFDRKSIDFAATFATAGKLLARTHDIRLLVLLAKLAILNRDLSGFARWLAAIAHLLGHYWDDVHPRGEGGDFSFRIAQLATLDDGPVVILPLQYALLAETQRDGVLVYRAQMVAAGEVKPREGENLPNAATIDKILLNVEMTRLNQTLGWLQSIKSSIDQIRNASIEHVGFEQAASFEKLAPLVAAISAFVLGAIARRDPSVAAPPAPLEGGQPEEGAPAGPAPSFASLADVEAALGAALAYFETMEPSSAAVLLIAQARESLGKNLYDVMKLLAPAHADNARVFVGPDAAFTVPVSGLGALQSAPITVTRTSPAPAGSRAEALVLLDSVAAHMRRIEPSSPAPHLLDRAKALATRDFLSLLQDLLPEDDLSAMKTGH